MLSVVIPSVNGLPYIDECLSSLRKQEGEVKAEIIVLNCRKDGTSDHIRRKFPQARLLDFPKRLGIPELRAVGMSQAKGDIIAVIEDHCIPRGDWYLQILKAHESCYAVIGGAVENGSVDKIINWAVYLCEYSGVMPPIPHGEVDGIAGNNASYKRWVIEKMDEILRKNYWEFFLHEEMKRVGLRFLSVPDIVVYHKKEFSFLDFLGQRFQYSRSFAAMRNDGVPFLKRIVYSLSTPFLPLLLLSRILLQILKKRRHLKEFLLSLPFLIIFMVSYAFGEFVGYLTGPANSLVKVE